MPVVNPFPVRRGTVALAAGQAVLHAFGGVTEAGPREWPEWALALKAQRLAGEAGVGDTAERILGPLGGDGFKRFFKALTGRDCGCSVRREGLNREFGY